VQSKGVLKVRFRSYSYNKHFKIKILILKGSQGGALLHFPGLGTVGPSLRRVGSGERGAKIKLLKTVKREG
jgi:hypothetical protein